MQLIISHIFSAFIFFQFIFVIHFLFIIIIIILYFLLFFLLPTPHAFFLILVFSLNLSYNFSFLQKYSQTSGEASQLLNTQSLIARSAHLLDLTHHIRFIQLTLNNPTVTSMSPGHGSLVHLLFWVQQVAWHIHYICLAQDAAKVRSYSRQAVYTLTAPRNNSLGKYIYYSRMLTQHTALISSIFMK